MTETAMFYLDLKEAEYNSLKQKLSAEWTVSYRYDLVENIFVQELRLNDQACLRLIKQNLGSRSGRYGILSLQITPTNGFCTVLDPYYAQLLDKGMLSSVRHYNDAKFQGLHHLLTFFGKPWILELESDSLKLLQATPLSAPSDQW